jgi:Lrp/AsnC family transcriptional regulator, regulator for asnA, asnC and gidA
MLSQSDLNIIGYLSNDPRCSVSKMAEDLEMPESTVRHRLNRILETGLIEFAAIVNPLEFGFNTWTIMEVQAQLNRVEAVGETLASFQEVYFVGLTSGGYDLLVGAVFRSTEEHRHFVTTKLANIPGIVRTSTSNVLKVFKRTSAEGDALPHRSSLENVAVVATDRNESRMVALRNDPLLAAMDARADRGAGRDRDEPAKGLRGG